jgi:hypothetical protein
MRECCNTVPGTTFRTTTTPPVGVPSMEKDSGIEIPKLHRCDDKESVTINNIHIQKLFQAKEILKLLVFFVSLKKIRIVQTF